MSTVTPSESASNSGKKKSRPGKNARMAARGGAPASSQSSVSNASFFSSQVPADPVPQPGKFPVVFRAGAGEPTRDVEFAYDADKINGITCDLLGRYVWNPRYAEFSSHADYTDSMFEKDVTRMFLLGLAQQSVHAHVNMGLPLGDFSSIASTDVTEFVSLSAVIRQFGEFQDASLGSRFLLKNYATTIASLVRAAHDVGEDSAANQAAVMRMWIPTKSKDSRTTFIVASALSEFIWKGLGLRLSIEDLSNHLFDTPWDAFDAIKVLLGGDDASRERFDFLFKSYTTEVQFVALFTNGRLRALAELGLSWRHPDVSHLAWELVPKVEFPELVDLWSRKRSAIESFISCTSGLANRSSATGSHAQVSEVSTSSGVTVVKTHVALSAPEFSLLSCFPPSGVVPSVGPLNVVLTTSIATDVRATEFLQLDWKG